MCIVIFSKYLPSAYPFVQKYENFTKDPTEYIDKLIKKRHQFLFLCRDCFDNDTNFIAVIDRSIKRLFNAKGTFRYADAFSQCCDKLFKAINSKSAAESTVEIETKILQIVTSSDLD